MATNFAGPKIADLFYTHVNFRWAFGAFCFILIGFCTPVVVIFFLSQRKVNRMGIAPERVKSRSIGESLRYYFVQFDGKPLCQICYTNPYADMSLKTVVGIFLTTAGWSLLLLPFSLANTAPNGWKTGYVIAMIVLGVACLAAFVVWERCFASVAYFPFRLLKDRTILGASLLYGIMFISI